MNCNCHPTPKRDNGPVADITRQIIVPCDPETIARLQAEYFSKSSLQKQPEPAQAKTARELCRQCRIKLKPGAEALLDDQLTPRAYFDLLVENDFLADARRVLAHAIPKRRALWWACLCAQDAYQGEPPEPVRQALAAVLPFVHDPNEANRREAERIGRSLPANRLEGCLAMAAFFSEGSVSLPGLPAVPPRPFVTGRLVGVCVYLASVIRSAAHYKDHLRQYLAIGAQIARGENLWYEPQTKLNRIDLERAAPGPAGTHFRQTKALRSHTPQKAAADAER